MHSGRSVSPCTSGTAERISSISSASGSPTLTSSTSAPPATCSATSISICDRSPAWSCAWKALRPVGLIRSPITQNGSPRADHDRLRGRLENRVHRALLL